MDTSRSSSEKKDKNKRSETRDMNSPLALFNGDVPADIPKEWRWGSSFLRREAGERESRHRPKKNREKKGETKGEEKGRRITGWRVKRGWLIERKKRGRQTKRGRREKRKKEEKEGMREKWEQRRERVVCLRASSRTSSKREDVATLICSSFFFFFSGSVSCCWCVIDHLSISLPFKKDD